MPQAAPRSQISATRRYTISLGLSGLVLYGEIILILIITSHEESHGGPGIKLNNSSRRGHFNLLLTKRVACSMSAICTTHNMGMVDYLPPQSTLQSCHFSLYAIYIKNLYKTTNHKTKSNFI
jgi:hypothetical protein